MCSLLGYQLRANFAQVESPATSETPGPRIPLISIEMDPHEFDRRLAAAELERKIAIALERRHAALKRQLLIWMATVGAGGVIVTLLLARALWHLRP
jgi:hypothetical protein